MLSWGLIVTAFGLVFLAVVIGLVLWLVLRKKPQPRGFEVIQTSPKAEEHRNG